MPLLSPPRRSHTQCICPTLSHDNAAIALTRTRARARAQVVNYTKANPRHTGWASPAADAIFGVFAATFLVTRLGLYPYYILYNTIFVARDAAEYTSDGPPPRPPVYWIFNGMLLILQGLHVLWAYLILRMVRARALQIVAVYQRLKYQYMSTSVARV
jgi:TLC domain